MEINLFREELLRQIFSQGGDLLLRNPVLDNQVELRMKRGQGGPLPLQPAQLQQQAQELYRHDLMSPAAGMGIVREDGAFFHQVVGNKQGHPEPGAGVVVSGQRRQVRVPQDHEQDLAAPGGLEFLQAAQHGESPFPAPPALRAQVVTEKVGPGKTEQAGGVNRKNPAPGHAGIGSERIGDRPGPGDPAGIAEVVGDHKNHDQVGRVRRKPRGQVGGLIDGGPARNAQGINLHLAPGAGHTRPPAKRLDPVAHPVLLRPAGAENVGITQAGDPEGILSLGEVGATGALAGVVGMDHDLVQGLDDIRLQDAAHLRIGDGFVNAGHLARKTGDDFLLVPPGQVLDRVLEKILPGQLPDGAGESVNEQPGRAQDQPPHQEVKLPGRPLCSAFWGRCGRHGFRAQG